MYLNPEKTTCYPPLQSTPAPGLLEFPDEFLSEFYKEGKRAAGFVVIEDDGERVTSCRWDEEAYQTWAAKHPAPDFLPAAQAARQEENKAALSAWLAAHPLTWTDGKQYGVEEQDQNEMALNLMQYQAAALAQQPAPLEWHAQKEACRTFEQEEYLGLSMAISAYVYPYRRYQEQVKEAIYSAKNVEEVKAVVIDYESVSHG